MIFQRRQKALIWSKGISNFSGVFQLIRWIGKQYSCMENNGDPDQLVSSGADCLAPGKLAVLDLLCFLKRIHPGSTGEGLR